MTTQVTVVYSVNNHEAISSHFDIDVDPTFLNIVEEFFRDGFSWNDFTPFDLVTIHEVYA
jgi:hypothetical protein